LIEAAKVHLTQTHTQIHTHTHRHTDTLDTHTDSHNGGHLWNTFHLLVGTLF
jgi:hypothetical protein